MFPFVLLVLLLAGGFFAVRMVVARRPLTSRKRLPAGYISDMAALNAEYAAYFGAPLEEPRIRDRFRQAAEAAGKGSMAGSTSVLETITKTAGLPSVYHDLGLGYSALGDWNHAADSFREVLGRDPEYAATRKFLRESKNIAPASAEPYTREQEPNNEAATANLISLRNPVGGELAGANDPADYFKIIAPAAPRDLITIELENHSIDFAPHLHVYDGNLRALNWGEKTGRKGDSVAVSGGPLPNSVLYVAVTAAEGNGGLYLLTVKAQKAYDKYEPNDDLRSAKKIPLAENVAANIMDGGDSDFFSFQSPRRGAVTIEIQNRSDTLIPALTMYNGERRNLGFAQEQRKPGANVRYVLDADKDGVYYIQISSQAGTAGAYMLRVD